jgi:hypothetical protein
MPPANFSIPLSQPMSLGPGIYWASVQANQDFVPKHARVTLRVIRGR